MSQSQQQPTPEQVYQTFNKSELDSRQMFEFVYNSFLQCSQELASEKATNAQLIEQLSQLTKQKEDIISKPKIIKPKGQK